MSRRLSRHPRATGAVATAAVVATIACAGRASAVDLGPFWAQARAGSVLLTLATGAFVVLVLLLGAVRATVRATRGSTR